MPTVALREMCNDAAPQLTNHEADKTNRESKISPQIPWPNGQRTNPDSTPRRGWQAPGDQIANDLKMALSRPNRQCVPRWAVVSLDRLGSWRSRKRSGPAQARSSAAIASPTKLSFFIDPNRAKFLSCRSENPLEPRSSRETQAAQGDRLGRAASSMSLLWRCCMKTSPSTAWK